MTEAIDELLSQHSVCTFRFYAQHAGVPASEAKEGRLQSELQELTPPEAAAATKARIAELEQQLQAVSYTHLTLPTKA